MPNLLIKDIDIALLEKQRQALAHVLAFINDRASTSEDLAASENAHGLLNMLDHWSNKTFTPVRVRIKEWFDKANGNSYFSARLWFDERLIVVLPMQYGYGEHGVSEAVKALAACQEYPVMRQGLGYWRYCEENQMKLEFYKETKCLKRDVKAWGER